MPTYINRGQPVVEEPPVKKVIRKVFTVTGGSVGGNATVGINVPVEGLEAGDSVFVSPLDYLWDGGGFSLCFDAQYISLGQARLKIKNLNDTAARGYNTTDWEILVFKQGVEI